MKLLLRCEHSHRLSNLVDFGGQDERVTVTFWWGLNQPLGAKGKWSEKEKSLRQLKYSLFSCSQVHWSLPLPRGKREATLMRNAGTAASLSPKLAVFPSVECWWIQPPLSALACFAFFLYFVGMDFKASLGWDRDPKPPTNLGYSTFHRPSGWPQGS